MRRLTVIVLFLIGLTAAFSWLFRFYTRRFEDFTGAAQWIWAPVRISRNIPVVFFAARDFTLPAGAQYAHVKLFAEPEYTLWFNGRKLASRRNRGEHVLDVYDVTKLARAGRNRIVVAVRSRNGVGGLLASVAFADENANAIVTDSSWRIFRRWDDALPLRDAPHSEQPMVLGEPPLGRWHYLAPRQAEFDPPAMKLLQPARSIEYVARIPDVKIVDGVAVATRESIRATAFDFGFTRGRVRLSLIGNQPVPPVVLYRLANVKEEFGVVESAVLSAPFGDGERVLTEPEVRSFRYIIVFGERARAEVVQ